ncbi:MAG: hypothetical protein R3D89_11035 [Sphingomonadaceae bacterium]
MTSLRSTALAIALVPALSGCVAKTAFDVVTAPVRVAGKAVDLATTSQSEADEKRGRQLRERDEELGKLDRKYRKASEKCEDGKRSSCEDARELRAEMDSLNRGYY